MPIVENVPKLYSRVADIGGGPGKIAFALADEGRQVDLIDLTPDPIQLAQAEQDRRSAAGVNKPLLNSITVGNALDKPPLAEGSYGTVLLLRPLREIRARPAKHEDGAVVPHAPR